MAGVTCELQQSLLASYAKRGLACSGMAVLELKWRREWMYSILCDAAVQVVPMDYVTVREVLWILVSHEALLRPKV